MMRQRLVRMLKSTLLVLAGSLLLQAQLDPKLQPIPGKSTDFLDLYQTANRAAAKPEVVTTFDFSGSMMQIMYHSAFPNKVSEELGGSNGGDFIIRITVKSDGSAFQAFDWNTGTTITANGVTYSFTGLGLVKPNGTLVTSTDADALKTQSSTTYPGASSGKTNAMNWVRCASHVRVKATWGSNSRTVDLPLPWTILDANATGTPLNAAYTTDPKTLTNIELDTTYQGTTTSYSFLRQGSAANYALVGSSWLYRGTYVAWIFSGKDASGNYIIKDTTASPIPFNNGLPNRTRIQAIKEAAIKTWLKYQDRVFWAMRGLESTTDPNTSTNDPYTNPIPYPANNSTTGGVRNWTLLNDDPVGGAKRISKLVATTSTPLTHALADTYFQLQNNSPFDRVHKKYSDSDDQRPVDCLKHFVILFTDGSPNYGSDLPDAETLADEPYSSGPVAGNAAVKGNPGSLDRYSGKYWNVPTLAGVAAHGGSQALGWIRDPRTAPASSSVTDMAPFWIRSRTDSGGTLTTFTTPHPIQTMTVGVSLGISYDSSGNPIAIQNDPGSPKYRLMAAATFGDPNQPNYDISKAMPFAVDGFGQALPNSVFYFDGKDSDAIVKNLDYAFKAINDINGQGIAATPVVPFSGVALATQIYLGSFQAPDPSSPNTLWTGDLLMFPTRQTSAGTTEILTSSGSAITVLDPKTAAGQAQWSAAAILNATPWASRTIYTRPLGTSANPEPGLVSFTDQTGTGKFDDFKGSMSSSLTDNQKKALVNWMRGADNSASESAVPPFTNRAGLMGDIINSAPAVLEYDGGNYFPAAGGSASGNIHRRLIFVGTNSGFLHAFAETSWDEELSPGSGKYITKGTAKELWAFIPTDLLPNLAYLTVKSNPHRFTVDGSPVVYHQDLPGTSGVSGKTPLTGDGKVNNGEKAFVIFGLRKGGRSYYALDVSDPLNPKMAWSLRADEAANIPSSRLLSSKVDIATTRTVVGDMAYATSLPAVGRVLYTTSGKRQVRPAVFLGGGLSDPAIEQASFSSRLMGRSALALDARTGEILQVWDLPNKSTIGSVSAGLIPFEFFTSSGLTQRAYFTDTKGGLWALGSTKPSANLGAGADYSTFRLDASDLDGWTDTGTPSGNPVARKIFQSANDKFSTLPAPFNIGVLPAFRTTDPKVAPPTVGVALVSGDRNNPLDLYLTDPKPKNHRINVIFDRQDVNNRTLDDSNLQDMTSQTNASASIIDPSDPSYYLKSKFGYYINFPDPSTVNSSLFYPKGINEPTVLAGVLFYSYFKPTSGDSCSPGSGLTRSWRVCDVVNPVVSTGSASSTAVPCAAGFVMEWAGVASNFGARGTVSVNQAGGVLAAGGGGAGGTGASDGGKVAIGTATGSFSQTFPKPRVWRTVHSTN